ncbi:MAG: proton-conducting transporter transmembrane domain-containing protein [Streptosporangiaceae bacterium]
MSTQLFLYGLMLGAAGAIAGAVLPARVRVAAAAVLTTFACLAAGAGAGVVLASGVPFSLHSSAVLPLTGVELSLDPFGAIFTVVAAAVGAVASWYAVGYSSHGGRSRMGTALLPLFITSLLLVPAAASVATFLTAWELMALTSLLLLLVDHRKRPEARQAAQWYAVMTHVGAAAILLGFVVLAAAAHGQSFGVIQARAGALPPAVRSSAFVLLLIGFASKAGAVPLHVWLPKAHPEAPSPVSALMSAAMVNLGIYGIIRTGDSMLGGGETWWWLTVAALGVVSALFGSLHATAATDLKRLLGYSTVDNMGLVLTGIGVSGVLAVNGNHLAATLIMIAALFHMVNHAAVKGCLFLGAGSVLHATGTRDLDSLGGLARRIPATAALFGIAALSMSALPPLGGFASEWMMLQGFLRGFVSHGSVTSIALLLGVATLALTGGLTAAAFVKAFGIGFLGQPRSAPAAAAGKVPRSMVLTTGLLAAATLTLGIVPGAIIPWLARAAGNVLGGAPARPLRAGLGLEIAGTVNVIQPALLAVALLAVLLLASALMRLRSRTAPARRAEAWGCGGGAQTPRMEYTATSFAEPLQRVFGDVLRPDRDLDVTHIAESRYFQQSISYRSRVDDAVERGWYRPVFRAVNRWGEVARLAQNGSVHRYLGYGFAALVLLLVVLA